MVKKRRTNKGVTSKNMAESGPPDTEDKTIIRQNDNDHSPLPPLDDRTGFQQDEITERGEKRKNMDQMTASSKLLIISVEAEIQTCNDGHSESKDDKNESDKIELLKNLKMDVLNADCGKEHSELTVDDTDHKVSEEYLTHEIDVHGEVNQNLVEIKTTVVDEAIVHSSNAFCDESNDQVTHDDKETTKSEYGRIDWPKDNLLQVSTIDTKIYLNVPEGTTNADPTDKHQDTSVGKENIILNISDKTDKDIRNEIGRASHNQNAQADIVVNDNTSQKTESQSSDKLVADKTRTDENLTTDTVTVEHAVTVTEVMQTEMTPVTQLTEDTDIRETNAPAKPNNDYAELRNSEENPVNRNELRNTGESELYSEMPVVKKRVEAEVLEKETVEAEIHADDVASIKSQPISHTDEDIYLQSTDPVNTENMSVINQVDGSPKAAVYDYEIVSRSPPSSVKVTSKEIVMLSPQEAADAPDMSSEVADDLTDSQLCAITAMDWSSQFPQELCLPENPNVKLSLTPQPKETIGLQPVSRSKPQDGTSVMRGLIREISQLNKMILKTKREMETVKHQRQQAYTLNRR